MTPARTRRKIAVAIVTWNSSTDLSKFLHGQAAVAAELGGPVVVVDNNSADDTLDVVRESAPRAELIVIANDSNRGYAAAVNQAFAAVPDHDVLLLNPDIAVSSVDEVEPLLSVLERNPQAGVAAPRLLNPDGSVQQSARRFPSLLAMSGRGTPARLFPRAHAAAEAYVALPQGSYSRPMDWVIGAAMLIRRQAFDAVRGWDEAFHLYLEDTDFCLRCRQAGWEVWYVPEATVPHVHQRASSRQHGNLLRSSARRHHMRSTLRFFAKHRSLHPGPSR